MKLKDSMTEKMVLASEDIHRKVVAVYEILHHNLRKLDDGDDDADEKAGKKDAVVEKYPVPY